MLRVEASGNWTIAHLGEADGALRTLVAGAIEAEHANIDLSGITGFDTSSAAVFDRTARALEEKGLRVEFEGVSEAQRRLLDKVDTYGKQEPAKSASLLLHIEID